MRVEFHCGGCYDKAWLAHMLVQMGQVSDKEEGLRLIEQVTLDRTLDKTSFVVNGLSLIDTDRAWKAYKNGLLTNSGDKRMLDSRHKSSITIKS